VAQSVQFLGPFGNPQRQKIQKVWWKVGKHSKQYFEFEFWPFRGLTQSHEDGAIRKFESSSEGHPGDLQDTRKLMGQAEPFEQRRQACQTHRASMQESNALAAGIERVSCFS
jgi:hypothetical protein